MILKYDTHESELVILRLNDQNEFIEEIANMKVTIDKIKSGIKSDFRKINSEIDDIKE